MALRTMGRLPVAGPRELNDSLDRYIAQVKRQYPLLKPEEETQIAIDLRNAKDDPKEYTKLRNKLHSHNLLLVVSIARKYDYRTIALEDLISAGNMGLLEAVDNFDVRLGYKFSTYAYWWIRQSIQRYAQNNKRMIRLPVYLSERLSWAKAFRRSYYLEHGNPPSDQQVADHLTSKAVKAQPFRADDVRSMFENDKAIVSLNLMVGDNAETELINLIDPPSDSSSDSFLEAIGNNDILAKLMDSGVIGKRERTVLSLRYVEALTLEQIGDRIGLSRERVRQIKSDAIRKLRVKAKRLGITID